MGSPDIGAASNWIDVLKWLVPLATSIVTAIIAVIVAIISSRQLKANQLQSETNREKLRLDLYNRRFEIYRSCLNLHEQLMGHGSQEENLLDPFFRAFRESRFMFPDSGVHELLEKLLKEGVEFRYLNTHHPQPAKIFAVNSAGTEYARTYAVASEGSPDAEIYLHGRNAIAARIKPFMTELEDKMAPFLNFHDL
jgi:hypothetical protein